MRSALPMPRHAAGFTLLLALVLLTALTLLALATHRAALAEARINQSLYAYQQAFEVAALQLAAGLQQARQQPATVAALTTPLPLPRIGNAAAWADASLVPTGHDAHCPALAPAAAERLHFEIRAQGHAGRGAQRQLVQGFWLCRELCPAPCTGMVTGPHQGYWYTPL